MSCRDIEKQVQTHLDKLSESVRVLGFEASVSSQQGELGKMGKCSVKENGQVSLTTKAVAERGSDGNYNTLPSCHPIAVLLHIHARIH